jgi:transcriptional regulator with XRE-family HTH domain
MDIVSRLKMFLEQAGISNSQFADTCDIPRPTLSQLLNGRNKKVSDEVIGKIHRAYPALNVMWLMFGDGEMLLNSSGSNGSSDSPDGDEHLNNSDSRLDDSGHRAISFVDDPTGYRSTPTKTQRVAPSASLETVHNVMRNAVGRSVKRGSGGDTERRVVNIVVYYNDKSFEEFGPM